MPVSFWEGLDQEMSLKSQSVMDGTAFYGYCRYLRECTCMKYSKGMGKYVLGGMSSGL